MKRLHAAVLTFLVLVAAAPLSNAVERTEEVLEEGLAFLARAWQGDAYDDAYLQFVYPDEKLDCSLPGCRLTYRLLDAYINLAFLDRAGLDLGPAGPQLARGRAVLEAIVPEWREKGLYNVTRDPVADGIALDTFCIVGLLQRDRAMADVAAAHLGDDGWLPEDHYDEAQSFRKLADETWCVRLLQAASEPGRRQVPRLARELLRQGRALLEQEWPVEFRVNVALHLLYLLDDLDDPSLGEERALLRDLLLSAAEAPQIANDLLTQANILEALAAADGVPEAALRGLAERLTRHQDEDGGWHSRVGESGTRLRVFTTMRALLALTEYRTLCGEESGPR